MNDALSNTQPILLAGASSRGVVELELDGGVVVTIMVTPRRCVKPRGEELADDEYADAMMGGITD